MNSEERRLGERLVAGALAKKARGEKVSEDYAERGGRLTGKTSRTFRRWVEKGELPRGRSSFQLTREHRIEVMASGDNLKLAHGRLTAAGEIECSLRTFERAVNDQMTAQERAYARGGPRMARLYRMFLERQEKGRGVCFEGDHKQVEVWVKPPKGDVPIRPYVTFFIDTFSRAIAGVAISVYPAQDTVLAAMGAAFGKWLDVSPVNCVPEILRLDRGLDFMAEAITDACVMLHAEVVHTYPYSPHQKGKIERVFSTFKTTCLAKLPFYTEGQQRPDGSLIVPRGIEPLPYLAFVQIVLEWVREYNYEMPHSELKDRPPVVVWNEDETPLNVPDPEDLRRYLLKDMGSRKVQTRGVYFNRGYFVVPGLNKELHKRVEVRIVPHHEKSIEVFSLRTGEWLGTGVRQQEATSAMRKAIRDADKEATAKASAEFAAAKRKQRDRWTASVSTDDPQEMKSVPAEEVELIQESYEDDILDALDFGDRRGSIRQEAENE